MLEYNNRQSISKQSKALGQLSSSFWSPWSVLAPGTQIDPSVEILQTQLWWFSMYLKQSNEEENEIERKNLGEISVGSLSNLIWQDCQPTKENIPMKTRTEACGLVACGQCLHLSITRPISRGKFWMWFLLLPTQKLNFVGALSLRGNFTLL